MKIIRHVIPITTDASGDGSANLGHLSGLFLKIYYVPGSTQLLTGTTVTITDGQTSETLYSHASIGTAAFTRYPRHVIADAEDGSESTTIFDYIPLHAQITLTVASGGNGTSGTFYIEEGR